ncbi:hypothetical protein DES53_10560 [Roseimicrobium gellanilyticum]|uniref:Lipoprotein n=1 Tax=Roseimicrobium gellanilyticum TaxID=748857 RepID=A0A366HMV9_9BACT|nr:hypothetical protein [Roseimicrobium gellanilyticum]RBP43662.1 hypothetical protein DES53_10560 [Roseimicrobium gellanilyticum]
MKLPSILSLAAVGASLLLTSCETTGDPNQGGLFGWSQSKADYRLHEREQRLNQLDRSNAYQQGRTEALENEYARKKNQQGSW